ncbi:MAG: hypothetical protein EA398_10980 [Deltaproteobacteria bacterium]|nr:MAG: hypothetical protein EA398_10980 [Deltaproteobacteria bacterium]
MSEQDVVERGGDSEVGMRVAFLAGGVFVRVREGLPDQTADGAVARLVLADAGTVPKQPARHAWMRGWIQGGSADEQGVERAARLGDVMTLMPRGAGRALVVSDEVAGESLDLPEIGRLLSMELTLADRGGADRLFVFNVSSTECGLCPGTVLVVLASALRQLGKSLDGLQVIDVVPGPAIAPGEKSIIRMAERVADDEILLPAEQMQEVLQRVPEHARHTLEQLGDLLASQPQPAVVAACFDVLGALLLAAVRCGVTTGTVTKALAELLNAAPGSEEAERLGAILEPGRTGRLRTVLELRERILLADSSTRSAANTVLLRESAVMLLNALLGVEAAPAILTPSHSARDERDWTCEHLRQTWAEERLKRQDVPPVARIERAEFEACASRNSAAGVSLAAGAGAAMGLSLLGPAGALIAPLVGAAIWPGARAAMQRLRGSGEVKRVASAEKSVMGAGRSVEAARLNERGSRRDSLAGTGAEPPKGGLRSRLRGWAAKGDPLDACPEPLPFLETDGNVDPARALRDLLLQEMTEADRAELVEHLRVAEGYRGGDRNVLMEFVIRAPDPVELLASHLDNRTIRQLHEARVGWDPGPVMRDRRPVCEAIARALGFTIEAMPDGLPTIVARMKERRQACRAVPEDEQAILFGTESSKELEASLLAVLRALAKASWGVPFEELARERQWVPEDRRRLPISLGSLVQYLERLRQELVLSDNPGIMELRSVLSLSERPFARHDDLARLRNCLAHPADPARAAEVRGTREDAQAFLDAAVEFLEDLGKSDADRCSIFPLVIQVQSITLDRWGCRTIEALTDDGQRQYLVTQERVRPGGVYWMYPLSNPVRVDPILIPVPCARSR